MRHDRAGTSGCPLPDLDWGHEHGTGADKRAFGDHGAMLLVAIVVHGHRSGADIHVTTDIRIPDVTEMSYM